MNLVLLGPPGAGKGTQAARIARADGLAHLSSGDILRAERKEKTDLGIRAQVFMDRGALVPDDLILSMMADHIGRETASRGFLLDGFPRTMAQAEGLDTRLVEMGLKIDAVISIEVGDESVVRRLTGRKSCSKCGRIYHDTFSPPKESGLCDDCGEALMRRRDDEPDVVRQRLTTYHEQTKPLVAYYRDQGVLRPISGEGTADEVAELISKACPGR
ncbi:MAG: adenylate kinase [Phycisphaerae bacterium]